MFLIRVAFWLGFVVLLLPADERQQARLYGAATHTVERVTTFCDRNPTTCDTGSALWATFLKKAEFGARLVGDLIGAGGRGEEQAPLQPAGAHARPDTSRSRPATRDTLRPADLQPSWRGPAQRI
jgi:hypothetical protein